MSSLLPNRIINYKVSATSPTDELLTLGQIFAEVGDYNASYADSVHLSVSRKCIRRLHKVADELMQRKAIFSEDDFYEMPSDKFANTDMSKMTVDELYRFYRQWPIRRKERLESGREHNTFFFEGRIVRELQKRKPVSKGERFKIDYCTLTYENELENLSIILNKPIYNGSEKIIADSQKTYTPVELIALVRQYVNFRDVAGRELLVEYVDLTLEMIATAEDKQSVLDLVDELVKLGRKNILAIPHWIMNFMEEAVNNPTNERSISPPNAPIISQTSV